MPRYQVHVVLIKMEDDKTDIVFETEPYGVSEDFETYDEAYETFYKLTSET